MINCLCVEMSDFVGLNSVWLMLLRFFVSIFESTLITFMHRKHSRTDINSYLELGKTNKCISKGVKHSNIFCAFLLI